MTVLLTWSLTNGGTSITDDVDHGGAGNNEASTAVEVFIRHNGTYAITLCKFYLAASNERYIGDFTADADLSEILGWGNATVAADFGGYFMNLNATGTYPVGSWPVLATKSVTSGGDIIGVVCRTGVGDSATNGIPVITKMGCTTNGAIQAGASPNVRFKSKFSIPQSEDTVGTRHTKLVLSYTYTS